MKKVSLQENGICAGLPRVSLCSVLPTPLEELPRLGGAIGGVRILIKRDDLTGLALGGNKIRNMEFIFGELLHQGCNAVITTAGVQSNMCRATAAAASRLGVKAVLVLRGKGDEALQGNLLLDDLLGADIRFIPTKDPYDTRTKGWLDDVKTELETKGHQPYLLHLTGVTATVAACAYVDAAEELGTQFDAQGVDPDYFFVTTGSGVTMAGLTLGFKHLKRPVKMVGVSSFSDRDFLTERVVGYANQTAEFLNLPTRVTQDDFIICDQYVGPGYAESYSEVDDTIRLTARNEGILLDPVYTGKCMYGLRDQVNQGAVEKDSTVIFLHSGGAPNLFVQ